MECLCGGIENGRGCDGGGAGSGRCGVWVADDGVWCDPGLVGVSAMP